MTWLSRHPSDLRGSTPSADTSPYVPHTDDGSVTNVPPDLSVIVPSVSGWDDIEACLASLELNERDVRMDVLVVDRCGGDLPGRIAHRFPRVRVQAAPPRTSIPDLRALGVTAVRAEVVAVIEDHVLVPHDWALRLLEAHRQGEDVIGGAVSNAATDRLVDWAAFLCEYSHLLPPLTPGASRTLTGNNTLYKRSLLERYRAQIEAGRWEDHLHDTLRADGVTLFCHPEIVVRHKKHYSVGRYLTQRYLFARSYAGSRLGAASWPARVGYAVAAGALPPVLLWRIVSRVAVRPGYRRVLAQSLPLITMFVVAWACGEAVGAVAGPGDSFSRVA